MNKSLTIRREVLRPSRLVLVLACGALAIVIAGLLVDAGFMVDALRKAGAFEKKGVAIEGIKTFIDGITDNIVWLGGTITAAAVALVGLLFLVGHTRAQDIFFKVGVGFGILVGSSGIVA